MVHTLPAAVHWLLGAFCTARHVLQQCCTNDLACVLVPALSQAAQAESTASSRFMLKFTRLMACPHCCTSDDEGIPAEDTCPLQAQVYALTSHAVPDKAAYLE